MSFACFGFWRWFVRLGFVLCWAGFSTQAALKDSLVAYWPMEEATGNRTRDLVNGYDLELGNLTAADLVPGRWGRSFRFDNTRRTLLFRTNAPGEALPINQHPAFSIACWLKARGIGSYDLRFFSEGSTFDNNPLFNLGTRRDGDGNQIELFFRQSGWAPVDHLRSKSSPLNGDVWNHLLFVQQTNGSRVLYINGVRDLFAGTGIPAKSVGAWELNTTSIGGILRSAPAFWFHGQIDDVALWSRPLAFDEIQTLARSTDPIPFALAPLAIRSFTSDLPAVAAGGWARLRWEVSKGAPVSLNHGVGDVSDRTINGVGFIDVPIDGTKTFELTITRDAEVVAQSLNVNAIGGVAPGWTLLDNFDRYSPGALAGQGPWKVNATGAFQIMDVDGNRMLAPTRGDVAALLPLHGATLNEGNQRTLFFRVRVASGFKNPLRGLAALTDRNVAPDGDLNVDTGPGALISGLSVSGNQIGAINGFQSPVQLASDPLLESGAFYNIWVDIENGPFPAGVSPASTGDLFTVYVQKNGSNARIRLFQDFISCRDPIGNAAEGLTTRVLDKLLVGGRSGHGTELALLFDDFYLSDSGYNSNVPRLAGFTSVVAAASRVVASAVPGGIQVEWTSGNLQSSLSPSGPWTFVTGVAPLVYRAPVGDAARYFRVVP